MFNTMTLFGFRQEKLFKAGICPKGTAILETVLYESSFSKTGTVVIKQGVLKNRHPLFFGNPKANEIRDILDILKFMEMIEDFNYNRGAFSCKPNLEKLRRLTLESEDSAVKSVFKKVVKPVDEGHAKLIEWWNEYRGELPKIASVTVATKKHLDKKLAEGYSIDDFENIFKQAGSNSFLAEKKREGQHWVSFSWVIKNCDKFVEGGSMYDANPDATIKANEVREEIETSVTADYIIL